MVLLRRNRYAHQSIPETKIIEGSSPASKYGSSEKKVFKKGRTGENMTRDNVSYPLKNGLMLC